MNHQKILIVDDEVLIAEHLKDILRDLGFVNLSLAHSKSDAIQKIESFKPDLVLLDIRMEEELEGISIAEQINKRFNIPFIFISAHSDASIIRKAVATSPAGYITKPYKKMDIYAAINLVLQAIKNPKQNVLVFKDGYSTVQVPADDILFAQSEGNYIHLNTIRKKYTIRYSLEWLLENVAENQFARVHRSYVVNLHRIEKQNSKAIFIGEFEIPVARNKQPDLGK